MSSLHRTVYVLVACVTITRPLLAQSRAVPERGSSADTVLLTSARDSLAMALQGAHGAMLVQSLPPGWADALRSLERQSGLSWRGPSPRLLIVRDEGAGFACEADASHGSSHCRGRLEAVRARGLGDSTVAVVIVFASSAFMDRATWTHELTHALLMQRGLDEASRRHDKRYFSSR